MRTFFTIVISCALAFSRLLATTWDEPWQDKIIKSAEYFVLAEVLSCDEQEGADIEILEQFGGEKLPKKIHIGEFSLLHITSMSAGHGPEFHLPVGMKCYFLLQKGKGKNFAISTPTSGFAVVKQDQVYATFRHSYHQAAVPQKIYERSMTAIFKHYHNQTFDENQMRDFISKQLASAPAALADSSADLFFLQHVALESIYHLELDGYCEQIKPFLQDYNNFHNQLSGARALRACNAPAQQQLLVETVKNAEADDFVKVACLLSLKDMQPVDLLPQLKELLPTASEEFVSFGGDIMDPRVGTYIPNVKGALEDLISSLEK